MVPRVLVVPSEQPIEYHRKNEHIKRICGHVSQYLYRRPHIVGLDLHRRALKRLDSLLLRIVGDCCRQREGDDVTWEVEDQREAESNEGYEHQDNLLDECDLEQAHLVIVDVEKLEHVPVACDGLDQLLQLGIILHFVVALCEALDDLVLLLVGETVDVAWQVKVPSHIDSLKLLVAGSSHSDIVHSLSEILQHCRHGLTLLSFLVVVDNLFRGLVGVAELDDAVGSELMRLEVLESGWNDNWCLTSLYDCAQGHERYTCLERKEI